ncbi:hypothetical protein BGLA2_420115 [Burkholderia gladioli]|nr:hypothetical protein BGLA2_420115 [Burkholderia gladioli]
MQRSNITNKGSHMVSYRSLQLEEIVDTKINLIQIKKQLRDSFLPIPTNHLNKPNHFTILSTPHIWAQAN